MRQSRDQIIGRIAEFADMKVIERRIIIRTGADRRAADRDRQTMIVRAVADVVHLLALDVHAAHQHRFRPFEILRRRGSDIFVDETDRPMFGKISRDQQQPLRRHESLHAGGQRISVFESAERGGVTWEHAQDASYVIYALSPHLTSLATTYFSGSRTNHVQRCATNSSTLWHQRFCQ